MKYILYSKCPVFNVLKPFTLGYYFANTVGMLLLNVNVQLKCFRKTFFENIIKEQITLTVELSINIPGHMFVQGYYITMKIFWINSTDCFSPILPLSARHMHVSKAPITCLLFVLVNTVRSWRLISLCKREMIVLVCVRTEEKWAVCYQCIPVRWDQHTHTHTLI